MPKKIAPRVKKVADGGFVVSLSWGDTKLVKSGATMLECFNAFSSDEVGKLGGKAILKVESGGKSAQTVLFPRLVKRFLMNPLTRELTQKRLLMALK